MISFSVFITTESTIALDELGQQVLPAVISELAYCGYTVNHDDMSAQGIDQGDARYRLEPGPATLTAVTKGGALGGIEILLDGSKFGIAHVAGEKDPLLWMSLVQLGLRLGQTYGVLPSVSDPDVPPNAPRSAS